VTILCRCHRNPAQFNTRGPTVSNSEQLSLVPSNNECRHDDSNMNNSGRVFTPAVQRAQAERGSAKAFHQRTAEGFPDRITPELAAFIAEQDTAFLATATADGAPYVQHRGGPKGFIKIIDDKTLGFADYRGNRQYLTLANLYENDRAYLFLLDPARRQRIKLWGRARVIENDPAWSNACSTRATRRGQNAPFYLRSRLGM